MVFTKRLRDGVRSGAITCSVRIWTRPHVKAGNRYKMEEGEIEVDSIEPIDFREITPELARESGFLGVADLLKIALGAPTAECRCVVIDEGGIAIYVADITYRSEVVRLHIDLLAHATPSPVSATVATPRGAAVAATPR